MIKKPRTHQWRRYPKGPVLKVKDKQVIYIHGKRIDIDKLIAKAKVNSDNILDYKSTLLVKLAPFDA